MPSWKKVVISGSDASLNSLNIATALTASTAKLINLPPIQDDTILSLNSNGTVGTRELITGSFITTASAANNDITFTKADSSQFTISVNTGSSTAAGYLHDQSIASTTWAITHSLDTRPLNVDIVDSNYDLIITEDISFPTVNTAEISFPSAQTGHAIFSSISASVSTTTLQVATDNGNTTTNDMVVTSSIAGNTYTLLSTGSIETTANIDVGGLLSVTGTGTSQFSSHLQAHCLGIGTSPSFTSGTIVAASTVTATNFITTSDKKLKSNIVAISESLDTLKQFTAYEYTKDGLPDAGFIAQEVQEVLPYAVFTDDNGYLTMNDRPILAHMHKAILELEKRLKVIELTLS